MKQILTKQSKEQTESSQKTKTVTIGAEATVYVWSMCQIYANKSLTYTVASSSTVTGLVFMQSGRVYVSTEKLNVIKFAK